MWATVAVHVQFIMYTIQGHYHVHHTRSLRGRLVCVLCKWPHMTGLVIVPVEVVDD